MSQAALARACGLSQGAIANYESKNRKNAKNIFRLAEALGVNAAWLAMGTGPMDALSNDAQSTQSTYRLTDPVALPHQSMWPFSRIPSEQYWLLSADERDVVESTVLGLIQSLRAKHKSSRD